MEEFVGKIWHQYITGHANRQYPQASVTLEDVRKPMAIFFRALGGAGGLQIESALETDNLARRNWLQKIAGTGKKQQLAWRDEETLRLPQSLALFPDSQLNRDLYLWLTAIATIEVDDSELDWLKANQQRTQLTLQHWPGLQNCYQQLLQQHLAQRPAPHTLPATEAEQEKAIQQALQHPELTIDYPSSGKKPPQPVPLWLHPSPPESLSPATSFPDQPANNNKASGNKQQQRKQKKRKQAEYTDMPNGKDGLLSFRLESLWSWAEYVKVDRTTMEDDDDDAMRTAEDMDKITLAHDNETTASKIRLDLDLPASAYDDIPLGEGIPIDEWDYKKNKLQPDYCRLQRMKIRHSQARALPARLQTEARKIRRHFEALRPERHWVNRQTDGHELDIESYISFLADRQQGRVNTDTPVYKALHHASRNLSCLLLADLSLSTDAYINDEARVIDVIRDTLYLFSEALHASGDRFALHGFSSRHRNHVRYYSIKDFQQSYSAAVRGDIDAIKPGYYTRMGTAIRYASQQLAAEPGSQKLLLILTDGKPNDLDKYEGRYGIEDTRMAVREARQMGLMPFCVTIDEQAEDYLPYLFGKRSYVHIHHAEELPGKLPLLYLQLTR